MAFLYGFGLRVADLASLWAVVFLVFKTCRGKFGVALEELRVLLDIIDSPQILETPFCQRDHL